MNDDAVETEIANAVELANAEIRARHFEAAVEVLETLVQRLESLPEPNRLLLDPVYGQIGNFLMLLDSQQAINRLERAVAEYPGSNRLKLELARLAIGDSQWPIDRLLELLQTLEPPLEMQGLELTMFRTTLSYIESKAQEGQREAIDRVYSRVLLGQ